MEGEKEKWKQREYSHLEGNYVSIRETVPSLWERRVLVTEGGDVLHILTLSQKINKITSLNLLFLLSLPLLPQESPMICFHTASDHFFLCFGCKPDYSQMPYNESLDHDCLYLFIMIILLDNNNNFGSFSIFILAIEVRSLHRVTPDNILPRKVCPNSEYLRIYWHVSPSVAFV